MMERLITPHCELMNIPTDNKKLMIAADYSLDGLNIKGQIPLHKIEAAICRFQHEQLSVMAAGIDRPRMNLLLSGPPGTGKTELVKYLGKTLNTKILAKAGSDLLDQYVGGTEQNIREAFRQAEKDKAILFLDEVDGLLRSRQMAARSWEVTQVNELLQQMENFNGILVCATNFADNLDPATIRRFTFKLEFNYLDNTGKKLFFERMFKAGLSCGEIKRVENIASLAPGDFRIVRQGFYYLDKGNIATGELLEALEQESLAKKRIGKSANTIGFN